MSKSKGTLTPALSQGERGKESPGTRRRLTHRSSFILHPSRSLQPSRSAFTLIELLVAVALVMMIMLMFAEVFRSATGMIGTQKGIAENDGRERTIMTALNYDIKKRTFIEMVPFMNGHDTRLLDSLENRQGYFYISENDPDNNTDDVLQFTVKSSKVVSGFDNDTPYFGRATSLQNAPVTGITSGSGGSGGFSVGVNLVAAGFLQNPVVAGDKINIQGCDPSTLDGVYTIANYNTTGNTTISVVEDVPTSGTGGQLYLTRSLGNEPEFDDGQFVINGTGLSTAAEVSYFLRHGNLYRRVLLIREPHDSQSDPSRPEIENGNPRFTGNYNITGNSIWNDFDYSIHRITGEDANENGVLDSGGASYDEDDGPMPFPMQLPPLDDGNGTLDGFGVRFHVIDDLSNASNVTTSLGIPVFRFGHAPSLGGLPREYIDSGEFIGRFTQQETSHPNFQYPGAIIPNANPMNMSGLSLNPSTGAVSAYEGTDRRGEDIIATNVHEFDIKVFTADFGADGLPGFAGVDDDNDGFADWLDPPNNTIPDLEEVGVAGSDDVVGFFDLGRGGNGLYTASANGGYGNKFDTWHVNAGGTTPYRHFSNGPDQRAGVANWDDDQLRPGFVDWELGNDGLPGLPGVDDDGDGFADSENGNPIDGADGFPGVAGVDDDGNGVIDDLSERGWKGSDDQVDTDELGFGIGAGSDDIADRNELGFIGTDDEVPLTAIQIRIRFIDAASNQMRQMTLIYALDQPN